MEKIDLLILGSGPAGYTAAIYACRANIQTVVYEGLQPGGQLTTTTDIENFPGYPNGISGQQMMEEFKAQAQRFGADVRFGFATKVDFSERPFKVLIDDEKWVEANAVIIATGANAKYLGLESEEKFRGQGVSACATCDGFFYRKKNVAVVGGGDTACEEASYLATLCNKVYMIVRRDVLRASKAMQERVFNTPNIEILWKHQTKEIVGDDMGVNGAILVRDGKDEVKIDIDGFFLAIGHHPNSDIFKEWVDTDAEGYIITQGKSCRTSREGIFAAGDVQDPTYRQAVNAAAAGCRAAMDAEKYLSENR
ncbi:MAG: thioredoxin-disulfide reductase [Candidatus Coprenecus sp.]|nr:thioredoxin-disulfide reductase [Candidatus Coprenecus sp.]